MEEDFEYISNCNGFRWREDSDLEKEDNWEDLQHESQELIEETIDQPKETCKISVDDLGKKSFFCTVLIE